MRGLEDEAPVSPAHLAVDCDFYKKKPSAEMVGSLKREMQSLGSTAVNLGRGGL